MIATAKIYSIEFINNREAESAIVLNLLILHINIIYVFQSNINNRPTHLLHYMNSIYILQTICII